MADKQVGAAYVFTLAKAERGKLAAGMVLAAIGSVLSLVPYIAVYRILEMIIARSMSATLGCYVCCSSSGTGSVDVDSGNLFAHGGI